MEHLLANTSTTTAVTLAVTRHRKKKQYVNRNANEQHSDRATDQARDAYKCRPKCVQHSYLFSSAICRFTTMSVAREALAIVFREHAGMLGSYKDDKRKIMKRTEEILNECEVVVMEHMGEGRWEELRNHREITLQRLKKITKTEETYVDTWFKHQKTYRKRQSDDRKNEARQLKRLRIKTQPDHI